MSYAHSFLRNPCCAHRQPIIHRWDCKFLLSKQIKYPWTHRTFETELPSSSRTSCCIHPGRKQQHTCKASSREEHNRGRDHEDLDSNQLQTALNNAIKSEDYVLASVLSKRLRELQGSDADLNLDWRSFGCPPWLAERAEQMGYRFPTGDNPSPARQCHCNGNNDCDTFCKYKSACSCAAMSSASFHVPVLEYFSCGISFGSVTGKLTLHARLAVEPDEKSSKIGEVLQSMLLALGRQ